MNLVGAIGIVLMFVALIYVLRVVETAREAVAVSRVSLGVLRDPKLDDDEKERALQKAAVRMFLLMLLLLIGFAGALVIPAAVIWGLDFFGLLSFAAVMSILVRWDFIAAASVVCVVAFFVVEKQRR